MWLCWGNCVTGGGLGLQVPPTISNVLALLPACCSESAAASAAMSLQRHHGLHPSGTISTKKLFALRLPWS